MVLDKVNRIEFSGVRAMFERASKMKNPIDLTIGQPDFDIPDFIKEEAIYYINKGYNRYVKTAGIDELRDKVLAYYKDKGMDISGKDVIITSGVSGALTLLYLALFDKDCSVLVLDPYFVSYKELGALVDTNIIYVDTYSDFRLDIDKIKRYIRKDTKAIIINSPSNPTGVVYEEEELQNLADFCNKNGILVISDEIYDRFIYDGRRYAPTIGAYMSDAIIVNGFSKIASFTGWRVGYIVADKGLIEELMKVQQYTFVCAPSFAQMAALKVFTEMFDEFFAKIQNEYKKRRDLVCKYFGDLEGFICPDGAFYAFLPVNMEADKFLDMLVEDEVLAVSGNVFSNRNDYIRISFANDIKKLEEGFKVIRRRLEKIKK